MRRFSRTHVKLHILTIMSKILIWCHGGCFGGGSVSYDKPLREGLAKYGWDVRPVDFPLDNYQSAIDAIGAEALKAQDESKNEIKNERKTPVVVGGISSGGLLAHQVASELELPALLVCPVLAPAARHYKLPPDLQMKQLSFFHTHSEIIKAQNMVCKPMQKRFILYGTKDTRAAPRHFEAWKGMDYVQVKGIDAGHELCKNVKAEDLLEGLENLIT